MLGQVISHYEVVGKLGAGGMGEVFEARDTLLHEVRDRIWLEYALSNARQAVEKDPLLASGHAALGLVLTGLGQQKEAAAALADALDLSPTNADAMRGLGDLAVRRQDFPAAEQHYKGQPRRRASADCRRPCAFARSVPAGRAAC